MGTRKFHLERYKHHRSAADYLNQNESFLDWAVLALFYAAHEAVHSLLSSEPVLRKDERHPRKHTSYSNPRNGGRGTNQLVKDRMRPIYRDYIDLFEASRRTRYDMTELGQPYGVWVAMLDRIVHYTKSINSTRPDVPTDKP